MQLTVTTLPGDGIGPEVTAAALDVLRATSACFGHDLILHEHVIGWDATRRAGTPLPDATLAACLESDAVLLGAVGHPDGDTVHPDRRPETGLLRLRRGLGCFANLRPVRVRPSLVAASPLKPAVVSGTDIVVVRELAGGIYYGDGSYDRDGGRAWSTMAYTEAEVVRIANVAWDLASQRRGHVVSVDKANVLAVSRLWRDTVDRVAGHRPEVTHDHMYVDRAAMELVFNPTAFDVILTANLFGDILSDQAASLTGSIGVLGSASVGGQTDLYEPVHGSAPDLAGRNTANPIGAIDSVALMFRHTFGLAAEARAVEDAVGRVLDLGYRTPDLATSEATVVGTDRLGALIADACAACHEVHR